MKQERTDHDEVTVLKLIGDLAKPDAEQLEQTINDLIMAGRNKIVLDLEEVRYVDSFSITRLLRMDRECMSDGGEIKLLRPRSVVKRFMSIGQVLELFDRFETKIEAIRSFSKKDSPQSEQNRILQNAGQRQKMVIMKLVEILISKGYFDKSEYDNEFNRSAHLALDIFRQDIKTR